MAGEIKQGVINQETIKANTPAGKSRIKIKGFSGHYRGVLFDDAGQSVAPVTEDFVEQFKKDFPEHEWEVEKIASDTPIAKQIIPGTAQ